MAVDYLSALNAGSGLNTTQIVDALVEASRAPKEQAINKKVEENNVKISGFGTLKQQFETFKTSMTSLDGEIGLSVASGSSNIETIITDKTKISDFSHSMQFPNLLKITHSYSLITLLPKMRPLDKEPYCLNLVVGTETTKLFAEDSSITNVTLTIDSTNNNTYWPKRHD